MNIMVLPALLLVCVAPAMAQTDEPQYESHIANVPSTGAITTVSVGSNIHEYSKSFSYIAPVNDIEMRGGQWLLPLTVPAGTQLTQVDSKTKFKACTDNGQGPCGLDDDGDGTFDRMAQDFVTSALKLKVKVPYSLKRIVVDTSESFKQVILYQGATSDTLRLSYREFKDNMARQAFTEELTIPLDKTFPQDIAVKAVKLRIHKINGLGMTYEVLP
jgi:hypothetical protein